jgi:hypothetical protein
MILKGKIMNSIFKKAHGSWIILTKVLFSLSLLCMRCGEVHSESQNDNKRNQNETSQHDFDLHDGSKQDKNESMQYSLLVAISARDFEADYDNDTEMVFGGGPIGGEVTIFVNDSPIRHIVDISTIPYSACILPIGDLLEPGKNRIRIEGKHTEKMFIKVVNIDAIKLKEARRPLSGFRYEQMIAKKVLDPDQKLVTLDFDMPLRIAAEYEDLAKAPEEEEKQHKELDALLDELFVACNNHDSDDFFNLLLPDLKSPSWYMKKAKETKIKQQSTYNIIKELECRLSTDRNDVKFISGKKSVLVYSGIIHPADIACFLQFEPASITKTKTISHFALGEIVFVRLGGKWVMRPESPQMAGW